MRPRREDWASLRVSQGKAVAFCESEVVGFVCNSTHPPVTVMILLFAAEDLFPFWREVNEVFAKCIGSTTEKAEETLFSLIGPSKAASTNRIYLRQIVQYADWITTRHVQVQNVNASIAAYLAFICHSGATKS